MDSLDKTKKGKTRRTARGRCQLFAIMNLIMSSHQWAGQRKPNLPHELLEPDWRVLKLTVTDSSLLLRALARGEVEAKGETFVMKSFSPLAPVFFQPVVKPTEVGFAQTTVTGHICKVTANLGSPVKMQGMDQDVGGVVTFFAPVNDDVRNLFMDKDAPLHTSLTPPCHQQFRSLVVGNLEAQGYEVPVSQANLVDYILFMEDKDAASIIGRTMGMSWTLAVSVPLVAMKTTDGNMCHAPHAGCFQKLWLMQGKFAESLCLEKKVKVSLYKTTLDFDMQDGEMDLAQLRESKLRARQQDRVRRQG